MSDMNVFANLNMVNSHLILNHYYGSFPTNPVQGELCVVDSVLFCYAVMDNNYFWVPITNKSSVYTHIQSDDKQDWVIEHNLGTNDYIYACYDTNNMLLLSNVITITNDMIKVVFTQPTKGRCVIIGAKGLVNKNDCSLTTVLNDNVSSGVTVPEVPTTNLFFQVEV